MTKPTRDEMYECLIGLARIRAEYHDTVLTPEGDETLRRICIAVSDRGYEGEELSGPPGDILIVVDDE